MINVKDQTVKEVIQKIHQSVLKRIKNENQIKQEIIKENRLFSFICHDFELEPSQYANLMNRQYQYDMTGNEVIQIFRNRKMANPIERKELFKWASEVAHYFSRAIEGDQKAYKQFNVLRKKSLLKSGRKHSSQERIAMLTIYANYPEIDVFEDIQQIYLFGDTFARYFFFDMADAIQEVYSATSNLESESKQAESQTLQKIARLENQLEQTEKMLQDLQNEFDEQIEVIKITEFVKFFSKLNSEKYGCILDELLIIKKGVDELRKKNYEIPIEINGLLIMVKKLILFIRDNHIEPIMKMNMIQEVTASDIESCNYEGTPFITENERKKVKVVSPGWVYKDKELQISRPKVKEESK